MPFGYLLVVVITVELGQGDTTLEPEWLRLQDTPGAEKGFEGILFLGEQREKSARQAADVGQRLHRRMPAQRQTGGGAVYNHQSSVDDQCGRQATPREAKMRATVENERSKRSDGEFEYEKRYLAVREQARHEQVAFTGDMQMDPEQRQLSVKPVQSKQQQAF